MTHGTTPGTASYEPLTDPADAGTLADCAATTRRLDAALRRLDRPAPSLHYDEQPAPGPKGRIEVSEAAARLAAAIYRD